MTIARNSGADMLLRVCAICAILLIPSCAGSPYHLERATAEQLADVNDHQLCGGYWAGEDNPAVVLELSRRRLLTEAQWKKLVQTATESHRAGHSTFPDFGMNRCEMIASSHYLVRRIKRYISGDDRIEVWKADLNETLIFGLPNDGHVLFTLKNDRIVDINCFAKEPELEHRICRENPGSKGAGVEPVH